MTSNNNNKNVQILTTFDVTCLLTILYRFIHHTHTHTSIYTYTCVCVEGMKYLHPVEEVDTYMHNCCKK